MGWLTPLRAYSTTSGISLGLHSANPMLSIVAVAAQLLIDRRQIEIHLARDSG